MKWVSLVLVLLLIGGGWYLWTLPIPEEPTEAEPTGTPALDCGNNLNPDGKLNIECFLNAYQSCTPATLYQELMGPDSKTPITTHLMITGKTYEACNVQVNYTNKGRFPEHEIYNCREAFKVSIDDGPPRTLKVDGCGERKPLFFN